MTTEIDSSVSSQTVTNCDDVAEPPVKTTPDGILDEAHLIANVLGFLCSQRPLDGVEISDEAEHGRYLVLSWCRDAIRALGEARHG